MILLDTGPIVGFVHADDQHHARAVDGFKRIRTAVATVWPVVVEAVYLMDFSLAAQEAVWEMIESKAIELLPLDARTGRILTLPGGKPHPPHAMSPQAGSSRRGATTSDARLMQRATAASVAVAIALSVIKLAAFLLTGSVALLASLVDSGVDALASVINLLAVRHALTPADREHRFGHGKAEPLAGLGQAAFIAGSALFLAFEACGRLLHPRLPEHATTGIVVMLASIV